MRFMILVKATRDTEAGVLPDEAMLEKMTVYHEEAAKAGVLLDANGLQPSSRGWRVEYEGERRRIVDGPFAESKELVAGYTILQTRTREEAKEWTRRFPRPTLDGSDCHVEVRQMFELADLGESPALERFRELGVGGADTGGD